MLIKDVGDVPPKLALVSYPDIDFIDVDDLRELPKAPSGLRYLDFIGGSKELRCFLLPITFSRAEFLKKYETILDECLVPILSWDGIVVRQDTSFAMPGFYIAGLPEEYRFIDDLEEQKSCQLAKVFLKVRRAMRECLNVEQLHFRCEEKPACALHYWFLPIGAKFVPQSIIDSGLVRDYLSRFTFSKNKAAIQNANTLMRNALTRQNLI